MEEPIIMLDEIKTKTSYYKQNPEKAYKSVLNWRNNNKDKIKEYNQLFYAKNKEKIAQKSKDDYRIKKLQKEIEKINSSRLI